MTFRALLHSLYGDKIADNLLREKPSKKYNEHFPFQSFRGKTSENQCKTILDEGLNDFSEGQITYIYTCAS